MSSQEEKDKIAEQIIKREKEKHNILGWLERNGTICALILVIITFIFAGIVGYNVYKVQLFG